MKPKIFEGMNTVPIPTLSIEDMINENSLRIQYNELENELNALTNEHQLAMEAMDKIIVSMEIDKAMIKEGTFDSAALKLSIENFNVVCSEIGIINDIPALSTESIESTDIKLSIEALDGAKKGLLARIGKSITNAANGLSDTFNQLKAIGGLVMEYDETKLRIVRDKIKDGELVLRETPNMTNNIATKLLIFSNMGNDIKSNFDKLIDHLHTPYNLIVKERLYEEGLEYVYDSLVQSKSNEAILIPHKKSIAVIDKFTDRGIRSWLNADTKYALVDRFIGSKVNIISVQQNDDGADARSDWFDMDKKLGVKEFGKYKDADIIKLIEFGIKLKSDGKAMADASKKMYSGTVYKSLTSGIGTMLSGVFGPFAIKRFYRQYMIANVFADGIINALLMLNKSHKDTPTLILEIVNALYETKK